MPEQQKDPGLITPVNFEPLKPGNARLAIRSGYTRYLVILALCLSVGLVWYLLSLKAVAISTLPQAAEISIDSGLKLRIGGRYLLRAGTHRIAIRAAGYQPLQASIEVAQQEQNQAFSYSLEKLPGHLRVNIDEKLKARATLDGEARGAVPATIRNIPPGEHLLRIEADRYLPDEQTIIIQGEDQEQTLELTLRPAWATLSISSEPPGAELSVDGDRIGVTPLTTEVLQGERDLKLNLKAFRSWTKKLQIVAGKDLTLAPITLQKADAMLLVKSNPDAASVTINGDYAGQTPLEVAVDADREIVIRLFKQGYQTRSSSVVLKPASQKELQLTLSAELSPVEFSVSPADAEIFIDGKSIGRGSRTRELTTVPHRVEIRKAGYVDYTGSITPRPGIVQTVTVSLKSERQAMIESIKPVIQTAAGQQLKLFRPSAEFSMGASRREAGRRANETIRPVRLQRAFYLAVNEVTNAEFRLFARNHASGAVQGNSLNGDRNPVVNINWAEAAAYCNWLSAQEKLQPFYKIDASGVVGFVPTANGYRLPTEAEWAWAARYEGPGKLLKFAWGDQFPPTQKQGNYADQSAAAIIARLIPGYNDGFITTAPVGSFASNAKGLADLSGNVAEWVHDFYDISVAAGDVVTDPLGPTQGEHHVIRGSSWAHGTISELRLSYRDYDSKPRDDVGFRIARYLE